LTQIGVKEVTDELAVLAAKIKEYLEILSSRERIMGIISDELREVKDNFAVPRRTEIIEWSGDMMDEDLIERRLYQTHGLGRFPGAKARRQGAAGHVDQR